MLEERNQAQGFMYAVLPFAVPMAAVPQAAAAGNPSASTGQLAEAEAALRAQDYAKAVDLFKRISGFQTANVEVRTQAQLRMGELFGQRIGVEQSDNNAWECYNCVAAQNSNQAAKIASQGKLRMIWNSNIGLNTT